MYTDKAIKEHYKADSNTEKRDHTTWAYLEAAHRLLLEKEEWEEEKEEIKKRLRIILLSHDCLNRKIETLEANLDYYQWVDENVHQNVEAMEAMVSQLKKEQEKI